VHVDAIKPTLKAPGSECLKLQCNEAISNLASNFNLRHYIKHATIEMRSGNAEVAAEILSKHGAPANPAYFTLYKEIAGEVLAGQQDGYGEVELKDFLLKLVVGRCRLRAPRMNRVELASFKPVSG